MTYYKSGCLKVQGWTKNSILPNRVLKILNPGISGGTYKVVFHMFIGQLFETDGKGFECWRPQQGRQGGLHDSRFRTR